MGSGPAFDANEVCPLFSRAPVCLRARSPTVREGHDETVSRINRSDELWGNG